MARYPIALPIDVWKCINRKGPVGFHSITGENLGPCWIWKGRINDQGYGKIDVLGGKGKQIRAHRYVYERLIGPISKPELDHLCRVRHCVNPSHLEPVTHAENMGRSKHALQTHCKYGHPLTEENTWVRKRNRVGKSIERVCRACHRRRDTAKRRRLGIPIRHFSNA